MIDQVDTSGSRPGRNGGRLRDFKKGESGNPSGRPVKTNLVSQLMREYGQAEELTITLHIKDANGVQRTQQLSYATDGIKTIYALIAVQLLMRAVSGDFAAMKIILDRTEGRVPAPMELGFEKNNLGKRAFI